MSPVDCARGCERLPPRTVRVSSAVADFGLRGWGPRVGLAGDPDQVVAGVHFDLGEFAPQVWFQPDVLLGFGDDVTSLECEAPVVPDGGEIRCLVQREGAPTIPLLLSRRGAEHRIRAVPDEG